MQATDYIRKLVALNNTDRALEVLEALMRDHRPEIEDELALISGQWHKLLQDDQLGQLSASERRLFHNRINNALLESATMLPAGLEVPVGAVAAARLGIGIWLSRRYVWLIFLLWLILAIIGGVLLSINKKGVQAKIEIKTNRVAFIAQESRHLFINKHFPTLQLFNFAEVALPPDVVDLVDETERLFTLSPTGQSALQLVPTQEDLPRLTFYQIELQQLRLLEKGKIGIQVSDLADEPVPTIGIDFQPGSVSGVLVGQDSLVFDMDYVSFPGHLPSGFYPIAGKVDFEGEVRQIPFQGNISNFFINLEAGDTGNYAMTEQDLEVSNLDFSRPDGSGRIISGLQSAQIVFLDQKGRPYRSISVDALEYLLIRERDSLDLISFQLSGQEIILQLVGLVDTIALGRQPDQLILQNPSWLQWTLHHKVFSLLAPVLVVFFISMGLVLRYRRF